MCNFPGKNSPRSSAPSLRRVVECRHQHSARVDAANAPARPGLLRHRHGEDAVGRQGAQGQQQAHLSERSAWRVPGSPCTAHDGRAPGGLRSSDYCRSFNRFGCPQSGQQFTSERRVNFPQCSQRRRSRMGRSWGFVGRVGAAVVRLSHLMQRTYGRVGSARTSDPHLAQYMAVIMIGSSRSASLPHVGFMMGPGAAAG